MSFCAACTPQSASPQCRNSFKRLGVIKVHWECWSACSLACSFCYRTRGNPLDTEGAKKLLQAISTSGALRIVFAGGDPSLRPDIAQLIHYAHSLNLQVEVHTNAQYVSSDFLEALEMVNLVGLSLDGSNADTHDRFRDKVGNFDKVINLLHLLNEKKVSVIVRSIVAKPNFRSIPQIAHLLEGLPNLVRWSLMEFSAFGEGFLNRERYELDRLVFDTTVSEVKQVFKHPAKLNIYRSESKIGTYVLITPSGHVYTTTESPENGLFPTRGSILQEHLSTLAEKLPFSETYHAQRYKEEIR